MMLFLELSLSLFTQISKNTPKHFYSYPDIARARASHTRKKPKLIIKR
jgi:hypothetical protein